MNGYVSILTGVFVGVYFLIQGADRDIFFVPALFIVIGLYQVLSKKKKHPKPALPHHPETASSEAEITFQYVYTVGEAIRAAREATLATSPSVRFTPYWGAFVLVMALAGYALLPRQSEVALFLILPGTFLLAFPLIMRFAVKRNFAKTPGRDKTITWTIGPTRLTNSTSNATSTFDWCTLTVVRERKEGFLLYPQPRLAHWIPKSAFASADDLTRFRTLVHRSNVPFEA